MVAESWFDAMGTEAHVVAVGHHADRLAREAESEVRRLEGLWSRFIETSEIAALNNGSGPRRVSPETFQLLERSVRGWEASGGRFDPTLVGEIIGLGYDEMVAKRHLRATPPSRSPGPQMMTLTTGSSEVFFEGGVRFDPGGIGKGLAADLVIERLQEAGAVGGCVNIGGDLKVTGQPPHGDTWTIEVEHPSGGPSIGRIALAEGAVATSSRARRRWFHEQELVHHLLDPRTGKPVSNETMAVTVIAKEGWWAEVVAKAAFVADPADALDLMERMDAVGLIVRQDGSVHAVERLQEFMTCT